MGIEITITHRCGTSRTFWAPSQGGYVRVVTDRTPGTLGWQPTIHGSTLTCGPSEASLRRAARRWIASQRVGRYGAQCVCGDADCEGVRAMAVAVAS